MARACFAALLLVLWSESAHSQKKDDWFTSTEGGEFYAAATMNDSGSLFGQFCFLDSGNCMYIVTFATACEEKKEYPVLANTDAGAVMMQIQCFGPVPNEKGKYRYAFTDFAQINDVVLKANRIGLAMPLESGLFNVVRFNLATSNAHIEKMRNAAEQRFARKGKPSTRNTRDLKM